MKRLSWRLDQTSIYLEASVDAEFDCRRMGTNLLIIADTSSESTGTATVVQCYKYDSQLATTGKKLLRTFRLDHRDSVPVRDS